MGIKVWKPLIETKKNAYLYHYTSMEKAYSILYGDELWFSSLNNTNDIFEQKVKISFTKLKKECRTSNEYYELLEKIKFVRTYMEKIRKRIKLLCFSSDTEFRSEKEEREFQSLINSLSVDDQVINVIGRGFALPRMWSQYAADNKGVCFIFNKEKLLQKIRLLNHSFVADKVVYRSMYRPYMMTLDEFNETYHHIHTEYDDAIKKMIEQALPYLKYDLFSKLADWSSENEFRVVLTNNEGEEIVKLEKISTALEGIVFGSNADPVCADLLHYASKEFDLRKLVYEDHIIRIK